MEEIIYRVAEPEVIFEGYKILSILSILKIVFRQYPENPNSDKNSQSLDEAPVKPFPS